LNRTRRIAVVPGAVALLSILVLSGAASAWAQGPAAGGPVLYPNSWALVVGVDRYTNPKVPRLNYAVSDARSVAAVLPALGFPEKNIRLLLDGEATKARIESVLYREFVGMKENDRLFVYFAGHGETAPLKGGEEGYLLPVDADPAALPLTAIAMDEIKRVGQRVTAKHVLFTVDACFSGFALTRSAGRQSGSPAYLESWLKEPAVEVLTAGRKGERAIEDQGHGLFTQHLIKGLQGFADTEQAGVFTAAHLFAWMDSRILRDSGGRMTPQYGKLHGEGQFVFKNPNPSIQPTALVRPSEAPVGGLTRSLVDPGRREEPARPSPPPPPPPAIDPNLAAAIKQRLLSAGFQQISVAVGPDGVVTLTGVLRTSADLQRATRLAQDFPGITGVRSQVNVQSEWLKR
jgi:uncharacterized caspase-like protein